MSNSNKSHDNYKDKNGEKCTFFYNNNDKVKIYTDVLNINIGCCK